MLDASQRNDKNLQADLSFSRSLVPLKAMTASHLTVLLQSGAVETVFAGQQLFAEGAYENSHVFLLHGEVELSSRRGETQLASARALIHPLAHSRPRRFSARAKTDCSVLRLDSEALDKLLTWSQVSEYLRVDIAYQRDLDEDAEWMMTVLKSNLFFKVPPINVQQIFSRLTPMLVDAGEVILRQGEIGDGCYFIKEGEAVVTRSPDGHSRPQRLAPLGVGRCFGEDALLTAGVRNATVTMRSAGVIMRLEKNDFIVLLREPQVQSLPVAQLLGEIAAGAVVIDVRTEEEYSAGHIRQAVNIPLNLLRIKSRLLRQPGRYIIYCNSGRRSQAAAHLLHQRGFQALALAQGVDSIEAGLWRELEQTGQNFMLRDGQVVRGQ